MKNILKWLTICLFVASGCKTHSKFAEFSDDHIRNYENVFGQSPPESVIILRSLVIKAIKSYSLLPPPEPSKEEWEKVSPFTWAFEMKAPAHYVEALKTAYKLELAYDRTDIYKQGHQGYNDHGPSWYPQTINDYVIYSYIFYSSIAPYWEMLIIPEPSNDTNIHFYIRKF